VAIATIDGQRFERSRTDTGVLATMAARQAVMWSRASGDRRVIPGSPVLGDDVCHRWIGSRSVDGVDDSAHGEAAITDV
jgi:hypothetical protein